MAKRIDDAPFTEPVIVPCLFVNGVAIEISRPTVRFIAWVRLPTLTGSQTEERRIVQRFVADHDVAANLRDDLARAVRRLG